ncbi:MAG TPA: hypothetical protein VJU59_38480 [Paraburkholderia sp.]|uniref:hypothetical protein n=1 Tax=Paraburkholderia sp. TaxID=1926495 RepID=UPI002B4727B8|nr:hypothetical protein [Paraburkholderia sp.]HKR45495.1 hypothetical protein [Paraburkholderia sp.]
MDKTWGDGAAVGAYKRPNFPTEFKRHLPPFKRPPDKREPMAVLAAAPRGYVAVAHFRRAGDSRLFVAPMRLMAEDQQPFELEGEALMAGYSAAQRLIDDALAD